MLLPKDERKSYAIMDDQLIENLSWRVVCEVARHAPATFLILETHPGGGTYDCLSMVGPDGSALLDFNRGGRIHFWKVHRGGRYVDNDKFMGPIDYRERLERGESVQQLVNEVCVALGLQTHLKRPPSTTDVLMARYITAFLSHATFGVHRWTCRQGVHDSSSALFHAFPGVQRSTDSSYAGQWPRFDPACHFWFLCRDEEPRLCLSTDGRLWDTAGMTWDLMHEYQSLDRSLWGLLAITGAEEMK